MPLIRIENYPAKAKNVPFIEGMTQTCTREEWCEDWQRLVAKRLRTAAVQANVPGIDESTVTVTLGGKQILEDDNCLLIIVEGLFDRKDRTKSVRDRFARYLAQSVKDTLKSKWKIEVLVIRFNQKRESFVEIVP